MFLYKKDEKKLLNLLDIFIKSRRFAVFVPKTFLFIKATKFFQKNHCIH